MEEDEADEVPKLPPDARLESLNKRLDRVQQAEAKRNATGGPDSSYRTGQLVLSYLIGAPTGGFLIGLLLDRWFGTRPWLMLILLFLGFVAGFINIIRVSSNSPGKRSGGEDKG
jgi:ATP synthase protein I